MADYGARIAELEKVVAELEAKALETERSGGPKAVPLSYARLREEIADYARFRDGMLADGLEILDADSDATGQTLQAQWVEHFVRGATDAFHSFKGITLEDVPSQIVAESIASQESVALAEISTWRLASVRGEVAERFQRLEQERAGLESKWSETVGLEERQDGQVAALRVEVLDMLEESVEKARGWSPRVEEAVRTFVQGWEGSERPSPDPSFAETALVVAETLATLGRTLEDSVRAALTIYATEQTIHEAFAEHRTAVAEMLEAAQPDLVKRAYDEAVAAAESGAARMSYDGQRSDLKSLLDRAKTLVSPQVDAYRSAFEQFTKHFDGRYTGRVGEESVKLLAEAEFFDQFWRDVEDVGLPSVIEGADGDIARMRSVDLARVTDEHREELRTILDERLDEVRQSIRNLDFGILERFRLQFIDVPRQAMVDRLRRMGGYGA